MRKILITIKRFAKHSTASRALLVIAAVLATALLILIGVLWGFSKSDWAAWVQAIGTVAAVLTAVVVVKLQHKHDTKHRSETERVKQRRQLNMLRWVFISIAETCEKVATQVYSEHVAWPLEAELLQERRKLLMSISVSEFPNSALLLRALELAEKLLAAHAVTESLDHPRGENVKNHVATILRRTRDIALTSVTETTQILVQCSSQEELDAEWKLLDERDKNFDLTKCVLAKTRNSSDPSAE